MYPASLLAQKFRPKRACSVLSVLWSIIMLTTPACKTYSGILANRFFLGVVEAGVNPIFMLVVGMWYTKKEQVFRSSIWYSFSGGSLLISPVINFGLAHVTHSSLHPWQIMYLFAGALSFVWGVALLFIFPDTPEHAKGFSESERQRLVERTRLNNAGNTSPEVKLYQIFEPLLEFQFWGIIVLSLLSCTGSAVVTQFASIVFNGLGFDAYTSLLLNLPTGAMAFICVLGSGYLGIRWKDSRFYIISLSCLPVILGCAILYVLSHSTILPHENILTYIQVGKLTTRAQKSLDFTFSTFSQQLGSSVLAWEPQTRVGIPKRLYMLPELLSVIHWAMLPVLCSSTSKL